jgi:ligand-binding sensor domain-containing protein
LFALCLVFKNIKAQQPAYFSFGEEQFRGVQIYDVIQDKNLNYWFATNEGLFYFDYYTYEKIECDKAKGSSVFNFTMSKEGVIYCHNLNNQLFEIKGKQFNLFYELTDDERSSDVSLSVANDGNLIVGAKKIIVLNKNGKKILQYDVSNHYLGSAFKIDSKIIFHKMSCDSILIYENGTILKKKLTFSSGTIQYQSVFKFFRINELNYALDLKTKELFNYNPSKNELNELPKNTLFGRSQSERLYESKDGLWVTGTLPGIALVRDKITNEKYPIYYEDYFISDVFKDNEGNILLSTFDKGILVIPDTKVPDVIHSFYDDPITSLQTDSVLGLVMGSSKGKLINYLQKQLYTINDKGNRPIEIQFGCSNSDFIIFDNGKIRILNKRSKAITDLMEASLKDVAIVHKNEFYLGTNRGVVKLIADQKGKFVTEWLSSMNQRVYSLEYSSHDSCLYASTASGFYVIFPSGISKKIIINNTDVFPNDILFYNNNIYASTKKNGIIVLNKGKIINKINPIVNEKSESLKKIIIFQNTIIAKSSNGLFQFDMNGHLLKSIHSVFGFSSKRIIDFTIHQQQLWVSHSGGVQQIDLSYSNKKIKKPIIRLDKILVNDSVLNQSATYALNSNQRKIQFTFSSPTIKNHQTIRYHYKLAGYDLNWNINNYESNKITYSALAPGDYTFYVKVENQGRFSESISHSFSISAPFYSRWWFIALVIMSFLVIVYFIYKWQLSIQQKKSQQINELNASKLTAIQSQMNPHFIFNSLNSIQDLILKGDVEHSYSYITTFSNLVRRTLSYSEKDFIDFDQEIKLLELYLSLEKLRFKKDFTYTIDIKNVEDIMLPPLLIQPFIENSLLHGLLHQEGQKKLNITFELKDTLICTIEDNGIGREKSKGIKLRQRSEHESFSGKAIHKRFEILSNVFEGNFGYKYEDLYENNEAIGTKVILTIPIKHKF